MVVEQVGATKIKVCSSSDRSFPDPELSHFIPHQASLLCRRTMKLFITDATKHIPPVNRFPGHRMSPDSHRRLNTAGIEPG